MSRTQHSRAAGLVIAGLLASLAIGASPVTAEPSHTPFTTVSTTTGGGAPERAWEVGGGRLQGRGIASTYALSGDLTGTSAAVLDGTFDPSTGAFRFRGTTTWMVADHGTFTGVVHGAYTATSGALRFMLQGADGAKITAVGTQLGPDTWEIVGEIIQPLSSS